MARLIESLNALQEDIVSDFINCGGRGVVHQQGRGQGYTTALVYLAMQQAALTKRKVWLFVDYPIHSLEVTIRSLHDHMLRGVRMSRSYRGRHSDIFLRGNLLRIRRIDENATALLGQSVDDAFVEIQSEGSWKYQEFFHALHACSARSQPGFNFTLVR